MTLRQEYRAKELMEYAIQERLHQIRKMTLFEREHINVRFDLVSQCTSILYSNAYASDEANSYRELRDTLIEQALHTGYVDKHGTSMREGDRVRWAGGEYIVTFSIWGKEWILKDDRSDYDCPSLEGTSSPQMSRFEIIG